MAADVAEFNLLLVLCAVGVDLPVPFADIRSSPLLSALSSVRVRTTA
jgi:hypothetical protein